VCIVKSIIHYVRILVYIYLKLNLVNYLVYHFSQNQQHDRRAATMVDGRTVYLVPCKARCKLL
jgi:hypothetical protein